MFTIKFLIAYVIPDTPADVKMALSKVICIRLVGEPRQLSAIIVDLLDQTKAHRDVLLYSLWIVSCVNT